MGNKFHGFYHGYEYQKLWKITAGVDDEQSVQKFNKILSEIHQRFISQRGLLETKYFMRHVMFHTSPKYQTK